MQDEDERGKLAAIEATLAKLRAGEQDPAAFRQGYVTPEDAPDANAQAQRDNAALGTAVSEAEDEYHRLHGQLVQGQIDGLAPQIEALAKRVERLRTDFLAAIS